MDNRVTLAVAGSRKTQGIIEHCAAAAKSRRIAVLTFTQRNQQELRSRLSAQAGSHLGIEVFGWYTFLLRHFCRPFLPFKFPGKRVRGFNFDGRPNRYAEGVQRFLDSNDSAYACELARLAYLLIAESRGALVRRLAALFDEIMIDEVQDLSGYDWEILDHLLAAPIEVHMVGDVRQSVLSTNARGQKNKGYAYAEAIRWFREREEIDRLSVTERSITWRCHQDIASFSDTIFAADWGFPPTTSLNERVTGHDGVYLLREAHIDRYVRTFAPQCLRHSAASAKKLKLDFLNFKVAKGATYNRTLIIPTEGIAKFITKGIYLEPLAAASFYVAVTRAAQSVAIVLDNSGGSRLPYWNPDAQCV